MLNMRRFQPSDPSVDKKKKGLTRAQAERVAEILRAAIQRRHPGEHSQRALAELTGLSQPVVVQALSGNGGIGVSGLIAIRNYTETPIDDLLGLPPLAAAGAKDGNLDEIRRTVTAVLDELIERRSSPELAPTPGKSDPSRDR